MKTPPILFFTFLLFLFFSCEVPKEKTPKEEKEEVKFNISVDSTKSIIKEPVLTEYIYKMYGCLNKDNLIPDGENMFILKYKNRYFSLIWKCEKRDCWLEDNKGLCDSRTIIDYSRTKSYEEELDIETDEPEIYIDSLRFSCFDLIDQQSIYNSTKSIYYRKKIE